MSEPTNAPSPSPAPPKIDLEPLANTMDALLTLAINNRDALYHHLLAWYDDLHASISGAHGDCPTTQQLARRRPTPRTYTDPSDPATDPQPTIHHPSPGPGAVCTTLVASVARDRSADDARVRLDAEFVAHVLSHLAAFDLERKRDESVGTVKENLDRLERDVRFLDAGSVILAAMLGEQLASVAGRAEALLEGTASGDLGGMAGEALGLLKGLEKSVVDLARAVRPREAEMDFAFDAEGGHPAGLMVVRARIRGMRGYRAWKEGQRQRAMMRVLEEAVVRIDERAARGAVWTALNPVPMTEMLPRFRETMRVAIAHGVGQRLSPYLNSILGHHMTLAQDRRNSMAVQVGHKLRDLGDGDDAELVRTLVESMQTVRAQLGEVNTLVEALSSAKQRQLRKTIENHDLVGAMHILQDHWQDDGIDHPDIRRRMYHCFAVYFLSSKATTLEQHLNKEVPYKIAHLMDHESVLLARLFCWGAYYFHAARDDHDTGCTLTALSWMSGLVQAWFDVMQSRKIVIEGFKARTAQEELLATLGNHQSTDALAAQMQADVTQLKRFRIQMDNLMHVTDVLVGLPPSVHGELYEPVFGNQVGPSGDHSVWRGYAEMRRFVTLPTDRIVLQGGNIKVSNERAENWD